MSGTKLNASQLITRLRARYVPPEWVILAEVRNATGFAKTARYADAIAMSTYPSKGLDFHRFEVKVSRTDWQKAARESASSSCAPPILTRILMA